MNEQRHNRPQANEPEQKAGGRGHEFSAPLNKVGHGRLIFVSGVQGIKLSGGAPLFSLLQARFRRDAPYIWVQDGIVTVKYSRLAGLEQLRSWRRRPADFRLSDAVPWEIEFRGGVSQISADLSRVEICSLDILGGASRLHLALSQPSGTSFVYVASGASQTTIEVPASAGVSVQISGGVSNLVFDGQRFGPLSAETRVQSPGYESTPNYYDIRIAGGASTLRIERKA